MMPYPQRINNNIIRALSKDCPKAFYKIYQVYKDKLYFYCLKFCKDKADAEELVQQVFIKLWEGRTLVKQNHSLEAYLFTITKHQVFDHLKAKSFENKFHSVSLSQHNNFSNTTEDTIAFAEYQQLAYEAIESLPEKRQVIFKMRHDEGLELPEIADMLQLSPHTIKSQLTKASRAIRKYLQLHGQITLLLLLSFLF